MGYKIIELFLSTDYTEEELKESAKKMLGLRKVTVTLLGKSLDARNKKAIHWKLRAMVRSPELPGDGPPLTAALEIPYKKRTDRVLVTGSGPAGFFAGLVLQQAGFHVTLIERGTDVNRRSGRINAFERTGRFDPLGTYAFGEGGAGTFSDGKLTSRSKHISKERRYVLKRYRAAGGPEDIEYLGHPHLGSDNLLKIAQNLRSDFLDRGGRILFETRLDALHVSSGRVTGALTTAGAIDLDHCLVAPGNAAFDTWRMLMAHGVPFRAKPFALGSRVEHRQEVINMAQWGVERLPGVKAAEYRLTSGGDGSFPVYTFCMCPGGVVVPSTAFENRNTVNGMSRYSRKGLFANAACVAGVTPEQLAGRDITPEETLDYLEELEESFYRYSGGYRAPFCKISDFIEGKETVEIPETSYPLGLQPAPLRELIPPAVVPAITHGLRDFCKKIRGFDNGIIMGLESKTSSPIQALRDSNGLSPGFDNLFILGEGSGWSGGILSSAADGIKTALALAERT
ncbi:MAG: FAD-dependent monooxygenase [Syntrophales bacterium]|nr:FAD-dependent monooxygenase [Syntrophales bacterium]